jgi:transglutaminase-like putative cysteine protease
VLCAQRRDIGEQLVSDTKESEELSDHESLGVYLAPAEYVDSEHPDVISCAKALTLQAQNVMDAAARIFLFVRDLRYGPPDFDKLSSFKASTVLAEGGGYCVPKAAAFTALCRAIGVPARLAFADVTNHLATEHTLALMGGALFAWHGYTEVFLTNRWIKVSPTFDAPLCAHMRVPPLEFDGASDAYLQAYDSEGRTFMRYERLHGTFHDVPARFLAREMPRLYPRAYAAIRASRAADDRGG